MQYLKTHLNKLDKDAVRNLLKEMAEVPQEMLNKIDMYVNLEKTYERCKSLFEGNPEPEIEILGMSVLNRLELPVKYSEREKYPLPHAEIAARLIEAFTLFVQESFQDITSDSTIDAKSIGRIEKRHESLVHLLKKNAITYKYLQEMMDTIRNLKIDGKCVLMLEKQFRAIIDALMREEFLPLPAEYVGDKGVSDLPYKSILSCYSRIPPKFHRFKTVGCIELVKLTQYAEEVLEYSEASIEAIKKIVNRKLVTDFMKISSELHIDSHIQFDTKDLFLVVTEDPVLMLNLISKLFTVFTETEYRYVIPNVCVDFADEDPIFRDKYFGLNAIYASSICGDRRLVSEAGRVLLTKSFFLKLPEHLQDFCEVHRRDYILDSKGKKTDIYRFFWEKFDVK